MRNYVFIKNRDISYWLEGIIEGNDAEVEVSENRKGTVLTFKNLESARIVHTHIEDERDQTAFALAVEPYTEEQRIRANSYMRSLNRINEELLKIVVSFQEKSK